jgi:non-heme chloroperoxidase
MGLYWIEAKKGVGIFVEDVDPGGGRPVLFVHGWPVNHKMFEYQFNLLPQYGFRCIGIDLRGFGKSDRPWGGYSYDQLADDVRAVIDALKLTNICLVGFSIGAAISFRYMTRHAGYGISKLAAVAPAAPVFTKRPDYPYGLTKEQVNSLILKTYRDRPKMLTEFGEMFFASKISTQFRDWFHGLGLEASGHGTAMAAVALRDEDLRSDVQNVRVPTAIFHGAQDKIVPLASATILQQSIPGAELYRFEHSGHGVFYDELETFNTTLVRFLSR